MELDVSPSEFINVKERFMPPKIRVPQVDMAISKIVGKTVYNQDPKLLALIIKWKKEERKAENDTTPSNWLNDPEKIKELKQVFS